MSGSSEWDSLSPTSDASLPLVRGRGAACSASSRGALPQRGAPHDSPPRAHERRAAVRGCGDRKGLRKVRLISAGSFTVAH